MSLYPKLKLVYFNAAGRAEAARLAFHIGNVPFEDNRVSSAKFDAIQTTLPYGQLPVLEVDGELFAQSQGILRYAGRLANLYPTNDALAALKVDEIVNAFDELQDKINPSSSEQDPKKKKVMREALASTTFPHYLRFFEARLAKMKQYPAFATNGIYVHDIAVFAFVSTIRNGVLDHVPTDLADGYPEVVASAAKVANHHKVKEWYASPRNANVPKLKLTYLDMPGRAEPIRLALHYAGIAFEDEYIDYTEVNRRRAMLPFGQVPVLEINGDVMSQSVPILRYVGTLTGLYPMNDPLEAMKIDEFFSVVDELYGSLVPTYRMPLEEQRAARQVLVKETFSRLLGGAEKRVESRGGPYAMGATFSTADLVIYGALTYLKGGGLVGVPRTLTDAYPHLTRVYTQVRDHPKLQSFLATRKLAV